METGAKVPLSKYNVNRKVKPLNEIIMSNNVIGLVAVVLGILCGIIAIVSAAYNQFKKQQNSTAIRKAIIENKVDAATAEELLEQDEPRKRNKNSSLTWGCALFGLGLGWIVGKLFNINSNDDSYWLLIVGFMGLGLIASFFLQRHFGIKDAAEQDHEGPASH